MYVYFNLNERDLLKVMAMYPEGLEAKRRRSEPTPPTRRNSVIPLFLGLATRRGIPTRGRSDFGESSVDPGTGTLQLRGVFPNPGQVPVLVPGLFSRLRMPIDKRNNGLLVTERAIGSDQSGRYLLVGEQAERGRKTTGSHGPAGGRPPRHRGRTAAG